MGNLSKVAWTLDEFKDMIEKKFNFKFQFENRTTYQPEAKSDYIFFIARSQGITVSCEPGSREGWYISSTNGESWIPIFEVQGASLEDAIEEMRIRQQVLTSVLCGVK